MPKLNTPTELFAAATKLEGVELRGTCFFRNGQPLLGIGQWQDTDRVMVSHNRRQRVMTFDGVMRKLKLLLKEAA